MVRCKGTLDRQVRLSYVIGRCAMDIADVDKLTNNWDKDIILSFLSIAT